MNISALLSGIPAIVAVLVLVSIVIGAALIFYALRSKGDVRAEFCHGRTIFKLEAKDRSEGRQVHTS